MPADRRAAAPAFRDRLMSLIAQRGSTQAAFARAIGLDRSTLTQLLNDSAPRLPRAETLVAIATACGVSVDWLLGLNLPEQATKASFGEVLQIEPQPDLPVDDHIFQWMLETAGNKIRSVPVSFPDVLKTEAVLQHEYHNASGDAPVKWNSVASRLEYLQRPETEIEACTSIQALEEFAHGQGIWAGLPPVDRVEQIAHVQRLSRSLYPSFRLFLFDRRRLYSVPFTVFGTARAAIFVGGIYFVFTWSEHVRALIRRFDDLLRGAVVQPPDIAEFFGTLRIPTD